MKARAAAAVLAMLAAAPAAATGGEEPGGDATGQRITLTPAQLLAAAERLVARGQHEGARPLVEALKLAPAYRLQSRFLSGLIARETGDLQGAADQFKAILADDPRQTRVRLELARVFLAMKRPGSADRQFKLAEQDNELPPEIARTIRTARDTIRSSRTWRLDTNLGFAPDTNINNATSAQSVAIQFGDTTVPIALNEDARARSGTGQLAQLSAGLRLPIGDDLSALAEVDGAGTNYRGTRFDDYVFQGAAGAEYRLSDVTSVSLQAVGAQRWFGGNAVSRQVGARIGGQTVAGESDRFGFQLDMRRTNALFDRAFDGWQAGLYGTYEHAVGRSVVASVGPFVRREALRERAFSSVEAGYNVGLGGELPHGVNFGASLGVSRAAFDLPLPIFDADPRRDWRAVARATLGNRKVRVLGLSPQLVWSYNRVNSSLRFYDTSRSRFELTVARYF